MFCIFELLVQHYLRIPFVYMHMDVWKTMMFVHVWYSELVSFLVSLSDIQSTNNSIYRIIILSDISFTIYTLFFSSFFIVSNFMQIMHPNVNVHVPGNSLPSERFSQDLSFIVIVYM